MAFPIGWQRSAPLVIPYTNVAAGNLSNFILYVPAVCLPTEAVTLAGTNAAQSDGGDLRFSLDAAGLQQLPCDLVGWSQNAVPANATAEIWVKVPAIYGDRDATIYVWYHAATTQTQPAANSTYGSQAVWSDCAGVWHLKDGSTLSLADSTANATTGTNHGTVTATTGKIDGGAAFVPASSQYVDFGNTSVLEPGGPFTLSCWVKAAVSQTASSPMLVSCSEAAGDSGYNLYLAGGAAAIAIKRVGVGWVSVGAAGVADLRDNAWHLLHGVFTGDSACVYVDGAIAGAATSSATSDVDYGASPEVRIASKQFPTQSVVLFNGSLDEVRIIASPRDPGWIATEYANQSSPATFVIPGTPYSPGAYATPGGFYGGSTFA